MAQDERNEETEPTEEPGPAEETGQAEESESTTDLDEDIAMALENHVLNPAEDPEAASDPRTMYPSGEFEPQTQDYPGWTEAMIPRARTTGSKAMWAITA